MINQNLKNAKILIVDDQRANVDLLEGFLEMEGYQNIKSTTDSREVLPIHESFAPDLILLDLAMPFLTGIEVMGQLKPLIPKMSYLPILVLSANITSEAKQRALSEGASDFLSKPFDLVEVGLRIRNLLYSRSLQQQLQNQNEQLEEKVKERTAELEQISIDLLDAKNKAEASDRLKTSFLQTISHEIRTPLNGILGFGSLLASSDLSPDEKEQFVEMMKTSADRLVSTISDYVNISLINSNTLEVKSEQVRVIHLLYELEGKFLKQCQAKGLRFELLLPDQPLELTLNTDSGLIRTLFLHILANALKFTNQGSISLGIEILPSTINFFVRDTGIGMDLESQEMIFDKFRQVDGSSTRTYEGSGLGLSICKGILRLLGGEISLESELGKGSTFYFTLPIQ